MATNIVIKELEKAGLSISKEKLIELIKKSNQQSFTLSQNSITKQSVVVINLQGYFWALQGLVFYDQQNYEAAFGREM